MFLSILFLISCASNIRNNLEFSVGKGRIRYERFFGGHVASHASNRGTVYIYEINNGKCKYELTVNDSDIITGYKFLTDSKYCTVPVNWGGG